MDNIDPLGLYWLSLQDKTRKNPIMRNLLFATLALSFLMFSCDKGHEPAYESKKITLSQGSDFVVYNGEEFELVFEVSPADYTVTVANLSIDDLVSNSVVSPEAGPSIEEPTFDNDYEIESVEPFAGDDGVVAGKWVARVREKMAERHISKTEAMLVIRPENSIPFIGTGYSGRFTISSIPRFEADNIDLQLPDRLSYMIPNGQKPVNAAFGYVEHSDMMTEGLAFGVDCFAGLTVKLLPNGNQELFSVIPVGQGDPADAPGRSFTITPDADGFEALEEGDFPVEASVRVTLTDIAGGIIPVDRAVAFYPSEVVVPAAETGLVFNEAGFDVSVPMKDWLARVGITKEYLDEHDVISLAYYSEFTDGTNPVPGLVFEEGQTNNDINDLDTYALDVADFGVDTGTYFGVFSITVTDPLTLRPLIAAKVKLEIVYETE